jgi:hypothetical protein
MNEPGRNTHVAVRPFLLILEFLEVLFAYVWAAFVFLFEFAFDMDYKKK